VARVRKRGKYSLAPYASGRLVWFSLFAFQAAHQFCSHPVSLSASSQRVYVIEHLWSLYIPPISRFEALLLIIIHILLLPSESLSRMSCCITTHRRVLCQSASLVECVLHSSHAEDGQVVHCLKVGQGTLHCKLAAYGSLMSVKRCLSRQYTVYRQCLVCIVVSETTANVVMSLTPSASCLAITSWHFYLLHYLHFLSGLDCA
jgi:hypothetical protein